MIGYVTLGTNDLERAAVFYDAIAKELGTGRMMEWPGAIAWGTPGGGAGIGLTKPFNGEAASVGNGVMVALEAKDKEQAAAALKLAVVQLDKASTKGALHVKAASRTISRLSAQVSALAKG